MQAEQWCVYETENGKLYLVVTFDTNRVITRTYYADSAHILRELLSSIHIENFEMVIPHREGIYIILQTLSQGKSALIAQGKMVSGEPRTEYFHENMRAVALSVFGHSREWYREQLEQDIRELAPATGTIEEALYNVLADWRTAEEKLNKIGSRDER